MFFLINYRPRFGLFSQPVSTAIGDTNKYPKTLANRDEEGDVIIGPRNFYTGRMKWGAADDSLFSKPLYAKGDKYSNPPMKLNRGEKDGFLKAGHEFDFIPAKICNLEKVPKSAYKYIP